MGLLDAPGAAPPPDGASAARQLETLVLKQVLLASGAFRGSESAGSQMWSEVLAEAVAGSVVAQQGLGLAALAEKSLGASGSAPVPGVTSGFGPRRDPLDGSRRFHSGVDIGAPAGAPLVAGRGGVVLSAGPRGDYGNAVEVDHGDGTTGLYAHADTLSVTPGQVVGEGETLGTIGSTGRSTGPHLHIELRREGRAIDPRHLLEIYRRRAEETGARHPPAGVVR